MHITETIIYLMLMKCGQCSKDFRWWFYEVSPNIFPILQMKWMMLGGLVSPDGASLEPMVCVGSKWQGAMEQFLEGSLWWQWGGREGSGHRQQCSGSPPSPALFPQGSLADTRLGRASGSPHHLSAEQDRLRTGTPNGGFHRLPRWLTPQSETFF